MAKSTQNLQVDNSVSTGLLVRHFSNVFGSDVVGHQMLSDFGESNTDISTWRPDISLVRAQQGRLSGKQLVYDFPDGKDNGEFVMTYIRNKGLDTTEVDSLISRIKISQQEKIDSAKSAEEKKALEEAFNKNIQDIRDALSSSSSSEPLSDTPKSE